MNRCNAERRTMRSCQEIYLFCFDLLPQRYGQVDYASDLVKKLKRSLFVDDQMMMASQLLCRLARTFAHCAQAWNVLNAILRLAPLDERVLFSGIYGRRRWRRRKWNKRTKMINMKATRLRDRGLAVGQELTKRNSTGLASGIECCR